MKAQICCSIAIAAVVVQAGFASVQAQGAPDIVWKTNGHNRQVTSIAIAPDGASLASGSIEDGLYGYLNVWRSVDTAFVKSFAFYHEDVLTVVISPDGQYLAEGGGGGDADDGRSRMWRTSDWSLAGTGGGPENDFVTSLAFSPDSSILAFGREHGHVVLARVSDSFAIGGTEEPPHRSVTSIAFSPAERILATAGLEGTVKIWDLTNALADESLLRTFSEHSGAVSSISFVEGGTALVSASFDATVIIQRLSDGLIMRTLRDSNAIVSMAVSADGKTLITASTDLKFWRVADGALLYTFNEESQDVGAVALAADGMHFAYGRADGAVVYARMPVVVEEFRQGDNIVLHWTGGSGLYRIQRRNHPVRGEWHNLGPPTTATAFTNAITREPVFYRVVSLPNR